MNEDGILRKVQALIDKAWSTTFPAERDALLAKAEAMMLKHSIDQFQLMDPSRPNTAASIKASQPELREIHYWGTNSDGRPHYPADVSDDICAKISSLFYSLAEHNRVRLGHYGYYGSKAVGYPADLDFLEMMFLSLKMHLVSHMDPQIDPAASWETNLAVLKAAGNKWIDIHAQLQAHPNYKYKGQPWVRAIGVNFTSVYKKWCEANLTEDEQRVMISPKQWREGLITGYVVEIRDRLAKMRRDAINENPNLPDLLASMKNPLDEFLWDNFPHLRPATPEEIAAREAARAADKRKPARYRAPKVHYVNTAAMNAGKRVAKTADLTNPNGRVSGSKGSIGG
jgi:hypothetical protein